MDNPQNESFVIRIIDTQNYSWQGTVTWMSGKETMPFRSTLELLKLIDSTIEAANEDCKENEGCEDN